MPSIETVISSTSLPYVPGYLTNNHNNFHEDENTRGHKEDVALNVNCSTDRDDTNNQSTSRYNSSEHYALASLRSGHVRETLVNRTNFLNILNINSFFPQRVLHMTQTTSL